MLQGPCNGAPLYSPTNPPENTTCTCIHSIHVMPFPYYVTHEIHACEFNCCRRPNLNGYPKGAFNVPLDQTQTHISAGEPTGQFSQVVLHPRNPFSWNPNTCCERFRLQPCSGITADQIKGPTSQINTPGSADQSAVLFVEGKSLAGFTRLRPKSGPMVVLAHRGSAYHTRCNLDALRDAG